MVVSHMQNLNCYSRPTQSQRALDEARQEILQLKSQQSLYEQNMKQAFMRGVCALNMEAMTMFQGGGGNGVTPANQEDEESDAGQDQEVMGSDDVSLDPPPPLPPSHSAPLSRVHGNQTNIPQSCSSHPLPSSQPSHFPTPHTLPIPPPTASVRIQTSQQPKLKSLSYRGRSTVGVVPRRRVCGLTKPAVMVERHTLG